MERITSHQVVDLMEAYNTVHAPQITEEQIQEDFENWVNSLVEEGHDLSEYTWDEMYEEYLNEYAAGGVPGPGGAVTMYSRPRANTGQPYQSRFARPMNAGTPQRTGRATAVSRPQVGGLPSSARQVTQYPQGVSTGVGGGNAAASRQAPAARPATPAPTAARPAPTAARPATPTPAPSAATTGFQLAQQGVNLAQPKKPSLASQAAELRAMQAASRQRQGLTQSFDVFDVVKGYLLDEGYADTEEAALQIMANMSEEWREDIIERSHPIMSVTSPTGEKRSKKRPGATVDSDYHEHENPEQIKNRRFSQQLSDRKKKRESEMAAGRLTVATKRGIEKATNRSNDSRVGRNEFSPGSALRRREEDDQPTDYRARRRRASGR
jgi:hypothetical protein